MANLHNIVTNPGLRPIRDQIFGYLSHEAVEICHEVSEDFNSWLERFCLVKSLLDFGHKKHKSTNSYWFCDAVWSFIPAPLETYVPGWKKGLKKFAPKASFDDLLEVQEFLESCYVWMQDTPVHYAARYDEPQMMQLFLYTDFDFNKSSPKIPGSGYFFSHFGSPFVLACAHGSLEVVKMLINSSKERGIDLNARDQSGKTRTVLAIVESKIKYGDPGKRGVYKELKTLLEEEYSKSIKN